MFPRILAFIDESGQRASTAKSSDCFVLGSVFFHEDRRGDAANLLAEIRKDTSRQRGAELHWTSLKSHSERTRVSQMIGAAKWLKVSVVVVCKRCFALDQHLDDEDKSYLFTFRFLLERLSWFAGDENAAVKYTLAHIKRFKLSTLREYENRLRTMQTAIKWFHVAGPGDIDQPGREELLQLADLATSAIATAFNKDRFGNTEPRYLNEILPRVYGSRTTITSYGLKMHPWNDRSKAAYPWVLRLPKV